MRIPLAAGSVLTVVLLASFLGCSREARVEGEKIEAQVRHNEREIVREEMAARTEHAETEAAGHGGHEEAPSPLTTDPDLAIYTAIVFGLLVLILGKFAWRPIAEGLDRREQTIAEQIEAASRTHEEAKSLLAQYEKRLANAQDEVRALLDAARRDAAHTSQEIIAKGNAEAEASKNRALRDIETARVSALKELAETSGQLAVKLAGRIVGSELDASRHHRLIQEALDRFPIGNGNQG